MLSGNDLTEWGMYDHGLNVLCTVKDFMVVEVIHVG